MFHQFPTPIPRLPKGVEVVVVLLAWREDAMVPREAHVAGPIAEAQHLGVVAHLRRGGRGYGQLGGECPTNPNKPVRV